MRRELQKLPAFMLREWTIRTSYRLSFFSAIAQIVFLMASFFFIGRLIDPQTVAVLQPYGGAYFPFVLIGLAYVRYLDTSLSGFAEILRYEQAQGTLEAILMTPTRLLTIGIGSLLWDLLWTTGEVCLCLGIGAVFFGMDLGHMNVLASAVVLMLSTMAVTSLGMMSAAGVLLFKEADPVAWFAGGAMKLLGGVYFPVAILPDWLERVAQWLPLTHILEGLRQAVLLGRSLADLKWICAALGLFGVVMWPLALWVLSLSIRRLKTTGALSFR